MKKFAVFDIDGTVIRWQLFHAVVNELVKQGSIDTKNGDEIRHARMTWKRRASSDSFKAYEKKLVDVYLNALTNLQASDLDRAIETIFDTYKDQVYTYTRDLIVKLKKDDYTLVVISGSHQAMIEKLATYYGFDYAIGTTYPTKDGVYTGEQITPVITGKGKLLKELVETHQLSWTDSIAVGDTASDISMLELVERPLVFNPNKELFTHVTASKWPIVVERKNMIYRLEHNGTAYILA